MISKNNKSLIPDIEKYTAEFIKTDPSWFTSLRKRSLTRFSELGLPTVKDEEWKYTNLAPLAERKFQVTTETEILEQEAFDRYYDPADINIIFVNGHFSAKRSNLNQLPPGVTIVSLRDAEKEEKTIHSLLERYSTDQEDPLIALNHALLQDGVFIKIDPKAVVKKLIHVIHVTSTSKENIIVSPRVVISSGKAGEAVVLESHLGFSQKSYFANALTDIFIEEAGHLVYCKAQAESQSAYHVGNTRVWQERDSQFGGFSLMTGAQLTRNNLNISLNGEGGSAILDGLYVVDGTQHVDNHTAVDHRVPNCTSNQLYKGILNDSARGVFNGKIFVRQIAQKTNSYQLNKNLLLGKDCRIDSKPQLEIFADDVKCTHGATIGQLNEDEVFYLQTRGVAKLEAVKMLCRGFVDDIINTVPNTSITTKLNQLLAPTFLNK